METGNPSVVSVPPARILSADVQNHAPAIPAEVPKPIPRIMSVDVLRGIVMFTMVFVNDLAGVESAPWWMKHYDESHRNHGNGMTFVDCVFPAFLFITGVSIPLAVESRRKKGDSWALIWFHILLRTVSLLFLGVLMVNDPSAKKMGWPQDLWGMLMCIGAILTFLSLPMKSFAGKWALAGVRLAGLAGLIYLAWVFKDRKGHHIQHDWWGILGLIGWAYFAVCLLAIPMRFNRQYMLMGVAVLTCMFFAERKGFFEDMHIGSWEISDQVGLGGTIGSQGAITMAGAILGSLMLRSSTITSPRARIAFVTMFAVMLAICGALLEGTFGISKNAATPTWCLWSAAITCMLWVMLYAVIDVAGYRKWATPLAWSGASVLLIYLLSFLQYYLFSYFGWEWYGRLGEGDNPASGILRSLGLAAVLSLIGGLLYRKKIVMRL